MSAPKIAINGFGRMGRLITRALLENPEPVDLVAINDLAKPDLLAHIFQYDSVHGHYPGAVTVLEDDLVLDGDRLTCYSEADPAKLPWGDLGVDYVIDATGRFRSRDLAQKHLDAGARRVVLSAPGKGDIDATFVRGINDHLFDPDKHFVVSNASCTTNCLAPVLKTLHDGFGVEHASMTTVHSVTNSQPILDSAHADPRRARSGMLSMIPTTTGAADAIGKVLPELDGKVDGMAIRVPLPNVSLLDLTARLRDPVSRDTLVETFCQAEKGPLQGILRCEERPLVSGDFNHDPHSAIVDLPALKVVDDHLAKVLAWYDNEWGYSVRMAELVQRMWAAET